MGIGIGIMKTFNLGLNTVNAPAKEKTAPDAPIAVEKGLDSSRKEKLPSSPPKK